MEILNIRFATDMNRVEFEDVCAKVAHCFSDMPGLHWKIWTFDEATRQGGGVYLFADAESLDAYLAGPVVEALRMDSHFSDVEVWRQPVLETPTLVTRGPIPQAVAAA